MYKVTVASFVYRDKNGFEILLVDPVFHLTGREFKEYSLSHSSTIEDYSFRLDESHKNAAELAIEQGHDMLDCSTPNSLVYRPNSIVDHFLIKSKKV